MSVMPRAMRATFSRRRWDMALAIVVAGGLIFLGRGRTLGLAAIAAATGRILLDAADVPRPRQAFPFWALTAAAVLVRWALAVTLGFGAVSLGFAFALSDTTAGQVEEANRMILFLFAAGAVAPLPLALWLLSALRQRLSEALGQPVRRPRLVHYLMLAALGAVQPVVLLRAWDAGDAGLAVGVLLAVVIETFAWAFLGAAVTAPGDGPNAATARGQ